MSDIETGIREAVESARNMPRTGTARERNAIVTGPHLSESLLQLLTRAGQVEGTAEAFVARLVGPIYGSERKLAEPGPADEPLFPALARRIVEINRTLERIEEVLRRGTETLGDVR